MVFERQLEHPSQRKAIEPIVKKPSVDHGTFGSLSIDPGTDAGAGQVLTTR